MIDQQELLEYLHTRLCHLQEQFEASTLAPYDLGDSQGQAKAFKFCELCGQISELVDIIGLIGKWRGKEESWQTR